MKRYELIVFILEKDLEGIKKRIKKI